MFGGERDEVDENDFYSRIIKEADGNGDDKISFDEFMSIMGKAIATFPA